MRGNVFAEAKSTSADLMGCGRREDSLMATSNDLSYQQFVSMMERHGFRKELFGYWRLPKPFDGIVVNESNGGACRREKLAFMLEFLQAKRSVTSCTPVRVASDSKHNSLVSTAGRRQRESCDTCERR